MLKTGISSVTIALMKWSQMHICWIAMDYFLDEGMGIIPRRCGHDKLIRIIPKRGQTSTFMAAIITFYHTAYGLMVFKVPAKILFNYWISQKGS